MTSSLPSPRSVVPSPTPPTASPCPPVIVGAGTPSGTAPPDPSSLLARLGAWSYDHRKPAVGFWIVALLLIFGAAVAIGAAYDASPDIPGSESAAGFHVLEQHFPELGTGGAVGNDRVPGRAGRRRPRRPAAMEEALRHRRRRLPRRRTASRSTPAAPSSRRTPSTAQPDRPTAARWPASSPTPR